MITKRIPRKAGQPANSDKHSDLYTDENPKGTITGLKFATAQDAKAIANKKEWQYLTEAEILEIVSGGRIFIYGFGYEGGIGSYTRKLFDKIEAKIKEKNDISSR